MSRHAWLMGALVAAGSAAVSAGPFGLNAGDSLEAIDKFATLEPTEDSGIYSVSRLPKGHADIEEYRLEFSPATGLCKVTAWTPPAEASVYGDEIRDDFRHWQEALTSKYGALKKFDYLRPGSTWDEPKDWTTALAKKERILAAFWWTFKPPVDQLHRMGLEAVAGRSGKYMFSIQYEFTNFEACRASQKAKRDANL